VTYTFKLQNPDGTPADPPTIRLGVFRWNPGDEIQRGREKLRVIEVRHEGGDEPPALVVEDVPA
jgi:hypothetical protein